MAPSTPLSSRAQSKTAPRAAPAAALAAASVAAFAAPSFAAPLFGAPSFAAPARADSARELRGVWITAEEIAGLASRAAVADALDFLAAHHFDVVYPAVWHQGHALFPSETCRRAFGVAIDPRFAGRDPLAELVAEAHRNGIEVVPWLVDGCSAGSGASAERLFRARPEWAARDGRGKRLEVDGQAWFDILAPEVQAFFDDFVVEIVTRYDVDGIQGDDRFPALPVAAAADARTAQIFSRAEHRLPPLDPRDPTWVTFRAGLVTDYLAGLRAKLRAVDPRLVVCLAPGPFDLARAAFLQDGDAWIERRLVDVLHPQGYARAFPDYARALDREVRAPRADNRPILAPGILISNKGYRASPELVLDCVRANRERGLAGEVHFSLAGLRANGGELGAALLAGPYVEPATLPYRGAGTSRSRAIAVDFDPEFAIGEWTPIDDEGRRWRSAGEGATGTSYRARIEAGAQYEVLLEVVAIDELCATATRTLRVGARPSEPVTIALSPGLVSIARLPLDAGTDVTLSIETGPRERGRLALGRAYFVPASKR